MIGRHDERSEDAALRKPPDPRRRLDWLPLRALVLVGLAALSAPGAMAAARRPAPDCTPVGGEAVRIDGVGPDLGLVLADGRVVRLAGIDPPRATALTPALAETARQKLATWLAGQTASMRPLAPSPDRWGRVLALVFAPTGPAGPDAAGTPDAGSAASRPLVSVSLALVDAGLARGCPEPEAHGCWANLLAAERNARAAGLGLWADPAYAVFDAADAASLQGAMGRMALVQGRVARVGHGRSRLFIGLDPGSGFELRLAKRNSFILTELGLDGDRLTGVMLRARGFLDNRFGASIDITDPDAIEILDRADAGAANPNEP